MSSFVSITLWLEREIKGDARERRRQSARASRSEKNATRRLGVCPVLRGMQELWRSRQRSLLLRRQDRRMRGRVSEAQEDVLGAGVVYPGARVINMPRVMRPMLISRNVCQFPRSFEDMLEKLLEVSLEV